MASMGISIETDPDSNENFEDEMIEHILTINQNKLTYENLSKFVSCLNEAKNHKLNKYQLVTSILNKALN